MHKIKLGAIKVTIALEVLLILRLNKYENNFTLKYMAESVYSMVLFVFRIEAQCNVM